MAVLAAGIPVARIELLDDVQTEACGGVFQAGRAAGFVDPVHGVRRHAGRRGGAGGPGAGDRRRITARAGFQWATDSTQRAKLWQARHDAYWACLALQPGHRGMTTDAIVPISKLAEAILGVKEDIAASGLTGADRGACGGWQFPHGDPGAAGARTGWSGPGRWTRQIVGRALALGGSVAAASMAWGIGKRGFLEQEVGHGSALDVMRSIKVALDPRGIMNPGKLFLN